MKKSINAIINELRLASTLEIELVLKGLSGEVKKRTLFSNLKNLEEGKVILKLLPKESSYGVEGYLPGPNMQVEEDFDVKRVIVEQGVSTRDLVEIDWKLFSSRVVEGLMNDLTLLKEDLEKTYDDPKNIEMRYFDISIAYHELYVFFFDLYDADFLVSVGNMLSECRAIIDKKEL